MSRKKKAILLIAGKKVQVTVQHVSDSVIRNNSKVITMDELNPWVQMEAQVIR